MRRLGKRRREDTDIWLTSGGHVWGGGWDINVCRVMCLFGVANLRSSAFSFVLPPTTLSCGGLSVRASKTEQKTLALHVPPPYIYISGANTAAGLWSEFYLFLLLEYCYLYTQARVYVRIQCVAAAPVYFWTFSLPFRHTTGVTLVAAIAENPCSGCWMKEKRIQNLQSSRTRMDKNAYKKWKNIESKMFFHCSRWKNSAIRNCLGRIS